MLSALCALRSALPDRIADAHRCQLHLQGILGLPVKLSRSGFAPFFLTFAACFALQLGAVWLMTDLLQYAHQAIDTDVFDRAIEDDDGDGEEGGGAEERRRRRRRRRRRPPPSPPPQPDLGQMCHLYLTPGWQRRGFDSAVVLQFGSILVSYALAGPAAYAAVLGAPVAIVTPLFVLGFATIIVTAARRAHRRTCWRLGNNRNTPRFRRESVLEFYSFTRILHQW